MGFQFQQIFKENLRNPFPISSSRWYEKQFAIKVKVIKKADNMLDWANRRLSEASLKTAVLLP